MGKIGWIIVTILVIFVIVAVIGRSAEYDRIIMEQDCYGLYGLNELDLYLMNYGQHLGIEVLAFKCGLAAFLGIFGGLANLNP